MPAVYVTEQRSIIRKTSDRLVVEKGGKVLMEIPCLKIDTILIYGNVQVTTQALVEMLDHGIELAILSKSGQLRGQLTPPKGKNIPLRMRQYEAAREERFCLQLAREVVAAKVENSAAVLRRYRRHHPQSVMLSDIGELESLAASARAALSLDSLRGTEGTAAARHFRALTGMVPPPFAFDGRNRRAKYLPACFQEVGQMEELTSVESTAWEGVSWNCPEQYGGIATCRPRCREPATRSLGIALSSTVGLRRRNLALLSPS